MSHIPHSLNSHALAQMREQLTPRGIALYNNYELLHDTMLVTTYVQDISRFDKNAEIPGATLSPLS